MAQNRICEKHHIKKTLYPFGVSGTRGLYLCELCIEESTKSEKGREEKDKSDKYQFYLDKSNIPLRYKEQEVFEKPTQQHYEIYDKAMDLLHVKGVTGMVFTGGLERGKTLLACIIGKRFMERSVDKNNIGDATHYYEHTPCLYTTILDMALEIKDSMNFKNKTTSVIIKFTKPDILIVDELGLQYGNDTEYLFITSIIDKRYGARKPTILIGNLTTEEVKETIGDKAYRRIIEKGRVLPFNCKPYSAFSKQAEENFIV